jgi:hypothetical protein
MATRRELKLHATHFKLRAGERATPAVELKDFDPRIWKLVSAEVRTDTGKFVNSAWDVNVSGRRWRVVIGLVVIGLHDAVETAFTVNDARGPREVVRGGMLYDFVERVNRELMQGEAHIHNESAP